MGHWSESLADEAAQRIGDSPDRRVLKDVLAQVGRELEVLSGRSFHPLRRATSVIEPNGLLFVDVPDLQVGSMEPVVGVWAVPDPVNRQTAAVLQVEPLPDLAPEAAPVAEALWLAGQLVARHRKRGVCQEATSSTCSARRSATRGEWNSCAGSWTPLFDLASRSSRSRPVGGGSKFPAVSSG